ncbi:uncharacterized protein FIBRA_01976 [Fibroporia radiculosa]|uniref:Cytochrome P450 n=1 Tax=Fibroporia radiculosa TaxID=599839 RepID=J4I8T1_9APHY|nr:uncharacterized protein FIBRA_01976 [Fibroporia radiculosa]CCL99951.1 predicted protein [Fibroporia radiculosa]
MVEISFGRTVTSLDDELVTLAENTFTAILETGGAATTLVDLFPILRFWPTWLPGLEFKRRASEIAQMLRITMDVPYEGVVKEMAAGVNKPSLLASLIEKLSIEGVVTEEDEEDLKGAITTVYAGGTDTTMTAIMTFILAMVMHPNIFLKAQAEVDQVTKGSRLPEFDDRHSLPYLECVLKEVYRWGCPLPLGVPHRLIEDDEYNGYHLPGGSTIIPNIWAMTRREDIYPDPERFFPERFESMDDETFELYDPRKLIFGFGRRICPGRTFADNSVWIAAASILSALDIRKARDQTGEEISPVPVFKSGFTRHVLPFECDIRPRSRKDV